MPQPSLIVIAKAPVPGRAKTRLTPPLSPAQAAGLAEAALRDTLTVAGGVPAARHVLAFGGPPGWPGRWPEAAEFEVIAQRGDGLAARLAAAFADVGGPALLVGMDTPQLTSALLREGLEALGSFDAVLGPALDGGYWSIGLREARAEVFAGVPMSVASTCAAQRGALARLELSVYEQPALLDVDSWADAQAVAALPECGPRFADAVESAARELARVRAAA